MRLPIGAAARRVQRQMTSRLPRTYGLRWRGLLAPAALVAVAVGAFVVASETLSAKPQQAVLTSSKSAEPKERTDVVEARAKQRVPKRQPSKTPVAAPLQPAFKPLATEAEHNKRLDAIIAPLLAYSPAEADLSRLKEGLAAIGEKDFAKARAAESALTDRAAKKLLRWALLRSPHSGATAAEIEEFRRANPDFPDQTGLRTRAEEHFLLKVSDQKAIIAFFEASPPQTGAGLAALAAAYVGLGENEKARPLAVKAWREHDLGPTVEASLLGGMGKLLKEADHKHRLDRLLMRDYRWTADRQDRVATVRRMLALLSPAEQQKANARLAVYMRQANATALMAALPAEANKEAGVRLSRIQLLRRSKKAAEAIALMEGAPVDKAEAVSPDDWWVERRALAYASLKLGQPKTAYALVSRTGPLSVNPLKEAEHFAGWLALRHLDNAALADKHFTAMRKAADGPLSTATAEYWLGRVALAKKNPDVARAHFTKASAYSDTFYGLLAKQMLNERVTKLPLAPPPLPPEQEVKRFLSRDAVRALLIARKLNHDGPSKAFLSHLRYHIKTPGETVLMAHLSGALGDTQAAVRTGKWGIALGHNLVFYAYPTHAFPAYTPLHKAPEPAFLLGIARQESEFNTLTLSGAGARGVLQVMPVTARHVCRDYKLKCDIPRLMTDPAYNAMLASAYIGDRMAEFSGSYIMTLAGYNAGPGRVREWVREFGDPREQKIDPIDWIERIPFEETREYVKKVLANVQVYRARLGEEEKALLILSDLVRARGEKTLPPANAEQDTQASDQTPPQTQR
ncbi:MAG: lytic transglycosylase domain-containing protein [Hyphomicrobiaceae bacterium]|nr:MAG: lytic transglycosylase domain-containing protein [Hyphomicrobiaceae bacterium]